MLLPAVTLSKLLKRFVTSLRRNPRSRCCRASFWLCAQTHQAPLAAGVSFLSTQVFSAELILLFILP
jgi:hypothetical protein